MRTTLRASACSILLCVLVAHGEGASVVQMEREETRLDSNNELVVSALGSRTNQCKRVLDARIVAWSLKASPRHFPPVFWEEVVVAVHWLDQQNVRFHALAYRYRVRWQPSSRWGPRVWEPDAYWQSSQAPNDKDILTFVTTTSFGNNEYDCDNRPLLVVLYHPSKHLLAGLAEGLPEPENKRRYDTSIALMRESVEGHGERTALGGEEDGGMDGTSVADRLQQMLPSSLGGDWDLIERSQMRGPPATDDKEWRNGLLLGGKAEPPPKQK